MQVSLAPTTEAKVNYDGSFGFSCNIKLADTQKIIVEVKVSDYDTSQNTFVEVIKKFQLEELHYSKDFHKDLCSFNGGVIRGFRKDGGLKVRTSWIPHHQYKEVSKQIPDHYHDPARKAFQEVMAKLKVELEQTTNKGLETYATK